MEWRGCYIKILGSLRDKRQRLKEEDYSFCASNSLQYDDKDYWKVSQMTSWQMHVKAIMSRDAISAS